uniref:DDE_Tnp_1_7 domain-containing protein n=1 Tax=Haemonchus placei TaxID=6290 RepID=A0A0N4W9V8_HAEPC
MMDDFARPYGSSDESASIGEENETLLNKDSVQPLVVPVQYDSSEDDEHEDDCEEDDEQSWDEVAIPYDRFVFTEENGPDDSVQNCTIATSSSNESLDFMFTETNRYAKEKMMVRNKDWTDTTVEEMKRLLGICLYVGIVKLPSMRDYWSTKPIFVCSVKIIVGNRFKAPLSCLHFVDKENADKKVDSIEINRFWTYSTLPFNECTSQKRKFTLMKQWYHSKDGSYLSNSTNLRATSTVSNCSSSVANVHTL